MSETRLSILWIFLGLAIFLGIIWQFYPLLDAQQRLDSLPLEGKDFKGTNVPLTVFEKGFFKDVNSIKRIYQIGDQKVFLYMLDGTRNRHVVHDPFYCFRGAGWNIVSQKKQAIPGGTANLVQLEKPGLKREALYWFSNGKTHYMSTMQYWWQTTLRRITLGYSGEEPVLIVVEPLETETLDWNKLIKDFPEIFKI